MKNRCHSEELFQGLETKSLIGTPDSSRGEQVEVLRKTEWNYNSKKLLHKKSPIQLSNGRLFFYSYKLFS